MKRKLMLISILLLQATVFGKEVKVFIMSGQSNMSGSGIRDELGSAPQLPSKTLIYNSTDGCPDRSYNCNWAIAGEQPELTDNKWMPFDRLNYSFGPEVGFARKVAAAYPDDSIFIIKASWGGTGLHQRIPTGYDEPRFDFGSSSEGWSGGWNTSGFKWNASGSIGGGITGNDPMIFSPDYTGNNASAGIAISNTMRNLIRIRYKNMSSGTRAQIYFETSTSGTMSEENSKSFSVKPNTSSYVEYFVDMSSVPSWNGNLKRIRFDPSAATSGSFEIDFIRIETAGIGRTWEFGMFSQYRDALFSFDERYDKNGKVIVRSDEEKKQYWIAGGTTSNFNWNNSGTISGTVTGSDPMVISPDLSVRPGNWTVIPFEISSKIHNLVKIRYKNGTPGTLAELFFETENSGWSGENRKSFTVAANSDQFIEYVIDMSNVPNWKGNLKHIRFDPTSAASGSFEIDEIKIETKDNDLPGWRRSGGLTAPYIMRNCGAEETYNSEICMPTDQDWAKGRSWLDPVWFSSFSGLDAYVMSPLSLRINIDSSRTLRVGIWNKSSSDEGKIAFITGASPSYIPANEVAFKLVPNDDQVREYVIDMSQNPAWKGTLSQIRIYPSKQGVGGRFGIDYVRFGGAVDESWLNPASDLFPWFTRNVDKALADLKAQGRTYKIEGIIWMQGETDATKQVWAQNYQTSLSKLVTLFRNKYGTNLPFFYGMIRSQFMTGDQWAAYQAFSKSETYTKITANPIPNDQDWLNLLYRYSNLTEVEKCTWVYSALVHDAQFLAQNPTNSICVEKPGTVSTQVQGCTRGIASYTNEELKNINNERLNRGEPAIICDPAHYGTNSQLEVGSAFGDAFIGYSATPQIIVKCRDPYN